MQGWGYVCLVACNYSCLACILPQLHLVSIVFGMAIPTSSYIFIKSFYTCFTGFSLYSTCSIIVCIILLYIHITICVSTLNMRKSVKVSLQA